MRVRTLTIAGGLLAVVLLGLTVKAARLVLAARETEQAVRVVARDLGAATWLDPAALKGSAGEVRAAHHAVAALQSEVAPLASLLRLAGLLPGESRWLGDLPDVLELATAALQLGADVAGAMESIDETAGESSLERYLPALVSLADHTPSLSRAVGQAEAAAGRLGAHELAGPLRRLEGTLADLTPRFPTIRRMITALPALAPALGSEGPKRYLLLGQNRSEIRASGGFLGTVGLLAADRGRIALLDYGSSYAVDPHVVTPPPPAPLARYLGLGGWYLRDANWWADFPATAAQVEEAWTRAGREPIDGVIGIDNRVLETVLARVGPLEIADYGTVSADTLDRRAAEELYGSGAIERAGGFHQAKAAFFAPLGRAVIARLLIVDAREFVALLRELTRLLDEKHIQVAAKDRRLAAALYAIGWDGSIPPLEANSLLVIDTTVSYGDTYPFIQSSADLRVEALAGGGQSQELALAYRNAFPSGLPPWMPLTMIEGTTFDPRTGTVAGTPGSWGNWLRIYLPPSAEVGEIAGLENAGQAKEFGRVRISGYLLLGPGEERAPRVRYTVPGTADHFRLFLQKQAGIDCRQIDAVVRFSAGRTNTYQGCPATDLWVSLAPDRQSFGTDHERGP